MGEASFPSRFGKFRIHSFAEPGGKEHIALVAGPGRDCGEGVLVRIHSKCLTGDALASLRCDCGSQLEAALRAISRNGQGILLYLDQEGRGIGLPNKIKTYALQDAGMDTVEANICLGFGKDLRDYGVAADILKYFGVKSVMLLTNNPGKIRGLEQHGIRVAERVPVVAKRNCYNSKYLETKKEKMEHLM